MAETKTPTGKLVSAHATITVIQPEADGGLIKDVKYRDLENSKCSDLVDGIIYINSSHTLNREVFGGTQKEYSELIRGVGPHNTAFPPSWLSKVSFASQKTCT
jgi:hypothetical protein